MKTLIESLYDLSADGLADYHPIGGNIIYLTQKYFQTKKKGLPTLGIEIKDIDTGNICGIIWNHKPNEIDWDYEK